MNSQVDTEWVKSIMRSKHGIEVSDLIVKPAIGDNENYGSTLFRLVLKISTESGSQEKNVILKIKSHKRTSYSPKEEEVIFETENRIYSEILEEMGKLIKTADNESHEILWPKYLGHKKLHLLMEDLSQEGFGLYPKEKPLDKLHTHAVMRHYGRFHGLGMILAQRAPPSFSLLRTHFITGDVMVMPKFYTSGVQGLVNIMDQWGIEWENMIPEIRSVGQNIGQKLRELALKTEETGPCVLNHGDCWTNNILFKYGSDNLIPKEIRLVDFQFGHFNSPSWDLTYFFYNALLPQERFDMMREYITSYTKSLSQTLTAYSWKGKIPSSDEILKAVQDLSYYGFINTVTIRPLLIASAEEGYILESEKLLDNYPGGPHCIHKPSFYNSPEIHDILKEEIKLYMKYKTNT